MKFQGRLSPDTGRPEILLDRFHPEGAVALDGRLRPLDHLVAINQQLVDGLPQQEIVKLLTGTGDTVELTVVDVCGWDVSRSSLIILNH